MKKNFLYAVLLTAVLLMGCRNGTEEQSGTAAEASAETSAETAVQTEASAVTTAAETTAEVTEKPAPDVYSENVKTWAETFAGLVYAELENNKTAENPTMLYPASSLETSEEALFNAAFKADIFFIDTDFDGVPELFAGGHGITGTGSYTVYTADGGSYGNGTFAHYFDAYCIADGCMFAHSGSTGFGGWTKLCDGLPTIFCNGLLSDEKTNNMTLRYSDGREQDFNGLTYDEAMDMYRKYLNIDFDKLKIADDSENVPFAYARGVLKVPDPENYTEEDICNCLAELLAEYEKNAGITSDSTNAVPPDSDFWLEMFEIWCSDEVLENGKELFYYGIGGSPAGSSKVFYVDIDGDGIKELCYIVDSFHGSGMYVCDYIDNDWKIVDALSLGYYTYLQPNDDGTTSLFVVDATRSVEPLDWYVYNKGAEEKFEFLDKDKLYEELRQIEGMNEQEEYFNAAIEEALKNYDNLINLYDMPYVMTMLLYDARGLNDEGLRRKDFDEEKVKRQLDEFMAEVAELFKQE